MAYPVNMAISMKRPSRSSLPAPAAGPSFSPQSWLLVQTSPKVCGAVRARRPTSSASWVYENDSRGFIISCRWREVAGLAQRTRRRIGPPGCLLELCSVHALDFWSIALLQMLRIQLSTWLSFCRHRLSDFLQPAHCCRRRRHLLLHLPLRLHRQSPSASVATLSSPFHGKGHLSGSMFYR